MEPPPLSSSTAAASTTTNTPQPYPDSLESSPRSRHTDSWDDPPLSNSAAVAAAVTSPKLRLMCSYGGHIVPRPHDKSLCYIGGDTRIIVVDRHVTLASLTARLSQSLMNGKPFVLKYQLPSEDLDSLISVTTDEDLDNMIEEYERTSSNIQKPSRLRLFLFQPKLEASQSIIESSTIKSDEWFLNALNGAGLLDRGFSDSASVNCLLGLDDELVGGVATGARGSGTGGGGGGGGGGINEGSGGLQKKVQDVHSVPDSPMMETSSSFGSSSSSPSLANLPPIRVHVEEGGGGGIKVQDQKVVVGIEEQFAQMNVGGGGGGPPKQQQEEGFVVLSSPAAATTVGVPGMVVPGEYMNRVFSDDERSDHGVPVGYRKTAPPPQPQSQSHQPPPQPQTINIQSSQQKSSGGGGGFELQSPDSVSSDSSLTNAINRQKPVMYQDQVMQIQSGPNRVAGVNVNPIDPKINVSDPNAAARVHIQQQVQDSNPGYILQPQFEQQQQQPQQQQPQQQQFIHAGTHYIQHHPAGGVPISAYYQVYPSQQQHQQQHQLQQHQQQHQLHQQQQLDQQYPVYYMQQARQAQAYNMSVQQPNTISEAPTAIPSNRPQTPPSPAMVPQPTTYNPMRNTHITKPEMAAAAAAGVYRTTTTGGPQLVQVPSSQHQQQYVGYSQMHHPSQSVVPTSAATANYGYEFADPAHAQIYYTQPLAPTMPPSHYQTMTGTSGVVLPEASGQLPNDNMKQQQIRTSQQL
ncbi:hypothetical protein Ddye_030053 [Dipteronia dyeriana]|uniref:PB1 domain-containing protein n=1 Tax=Dipteronia dyeriana TaxID=168575 RepID=A0AAD9TFY4_9ROSI|nr:hypothetical protein Ddye_030053 [Dipteronia dyeriana]